MLDDYQEIKLEIFQHQSETIQTQTEIIQLQSEVINDLFHLLMQYMEVEEIDRLTIKEKIDRAAMLRAELSY